MDLHRYSLAEELILLLSLQVLLQKLVLIVTYVQNTVELFLNPEVPSVSLVYYLHLAVYLAHVVVTRTVGLLPTVGSNRIS